MYQDGAVGLEHQQPHGFGQARCQTTCVENLAARDDETHAATVLSVSDSTPRQI